MRRADSGCRARIDTHTVHREHTASRSPRASSDATHATHAATATPSVRARAAEPCSARAVQIVEIPQPATQGHAHPARGGRPLMADHRGPSLQVAWPGRRPRCAGLRSQPRTRGVSLSARGVSLSSSLGHALFSAAFSALAFALAGGDERHVLRDAVRLRNLRRAVARVLARVAGGEDRLLVAHHARPRLKGGRSACTSVQLQVPEGATGVRAGPPSKIQSPSDISRQMSASERGALVSRAWFNLNGTQFRAPRAAPTS